MDLVSEIREKLKALESDSSFDGISAAIRHIEVAERHLKRARYENEEDFFNDVIYRTNQSFEGMLKEAYTVLTGRDGTKLSSYQIEQHLLDQKVFTPRVLDIFTNYRQNWRNPSTHDHKLLFSEQEAFLAIVNISAFAIILLDQIIESVNFKRELEKVERNEETIKKEIKDYKNLRFDEQLISLITAFNNYIKSSEMNLGEIKEIEILGRLQGFLSSLDDSIKIIREPIISQEKHYRADLVLKKGNEEVIVELKRAWKKGLGFYRALDQMQAYLESGDFNRGILYFYPTETEQEFTIGKIELKFGEKKPYLYIIMPKGKDYKDIINKLMNKYTEIKIKKFLSET